jgi:predicted TIM-barrel fold metal-dependent hydrolase
MIKRREFIGGSIGVGLVAATQGALPLQAQPAKKRLIVDAQVHLWKAESADWKWVPGLKPQLPEPFTIEKLVPMMDEAGVDRVVVVPPSWPGDRNDYGLEAAKRYPKRFAVMGRVPLKNPKAAELLPRWKEQSGMLGVRLTFLGPAAKWLDDGTADWIWPACEKAGLPIMFLASMKGSEMAKVAERHPGLTLIVDHMGVISAVAQAGKTGEAIKHTVSLAKFPNVSVKVSASPLMSKESYPFKDVTPHIKAVFDAFGPRRCYWGTDMTNSFEKATYRQRITHFTETLDFLSEEDKDWVMGRGILERLKWA